MITVGRYDKSFTLLELTPGTPNKELKGTLDDVEITFNLPSPDDPETASVTAASAQGTRASDHRGAIGRPGSPSKAICSN